MIIRDTPTGYGLITRLFHWLMAIAIVVVFGLGYWMVGLDYYSAYYTLAPDLHRSVGMLLLFALLLRWAWRLSNIHPGDEELSRVERIGSKIVHEGFYPLLLALLISGYFISTSEGRGIDVFGLFTVPAVISSKEIGQATGLIHKILAYITMALAAVHTAAALKHHIVDKSRILKRMWSGPA